MIKSLDVAYFFLLLQPASEEEEKMFKVLWGMKRGLNYFKISLAGMLNMITFATRFERNGN